MKIQTAFLTLLLSLLTVQSAAAAVVSRKDLEAIQMQVEQKSVEHKRLQAQAAKISVEMATVSKWCKRHGKFKTPKTEFRRWKNSWRGCKKN